MINSLHFGAVVFTNIARIENNTHLQAIKTVLVLLRIYRLRLGSDVSHHEERLGRNKRGINSRELKVNYKVMVILKNIPRILSPELLSVLARMGHGDEIVLADANFPSASVAKSGPELASVYLERFTLC